MKATAKSMKASRRLRRQMSPPEALLWQLLRGSPAGIRFRRQYAIGPYVADFYCPTARLVIEIDGQVHDSAEAAARDKARDELIAGFGVRIERVPAAQVMRDATAVASAIVDLCMAQARPLRRPALPAGPPPHELRSQGGTRRSA